MVGCVSRLKLLDEHATDAMLFHGFRDTWWNIPQVLANRHCLMVGRFQAENGVKLFRRVLDVRSLVHWESIRDEVHAMESHNVVEPRHRRMEHLPP